DEAQASEGEEDETMGKSGTTIDFSGNISDMHGLATSDYELHQDPLISSHKIYNIRGDALGNVICFGGVINPLFGATLEFGQMADMWASVEQTVAGGNENMLLPLQQANMGMEVDKDKPSTIDFNSRVSLYPG
ncbi:hypothetical protein BGZ74_001913, partial [Mortierella antarctica]